MSIYFLRASGLVQVGPDPHLLVRDPIKIGTTGRIPRRLAELSDLEDGVELTLLGVMDGARPEEQALHRQFAALRILPEKPGQGTEWFRPGPALLDWIAEHARPYVPLDDPDLDAQAGRLVKVQVRADCVHDAKQAARLKGALLADYVSGAIREATERDLGAFDQPSNRKPTGT